MKTSYILVSILLLCFCTQAQTSKSVTKDEGEIAVSLCDLIKKPENYAGKEVVVKATYRYSFEHAELYCLGCKENKVWVEFDESFKKNSKAKYVKKIKDNGFRGRTVNVEVAGTLFSGGGYGHFGIYQFKFVVTSLRNAEIIADSGGDPDALSEGQQRKVCQR